MQALPRLNDLTLARLPGHVARPAYDRASTRIGVVHLGPGAFHRAHQAAFIETLLARDPRWAICAISLKNRSLSEALTPQDGLYALAELDAEASLRVIGAIKEVLAATESPEAALARMAARQTGLVTLTVTEKGYCLGADGRLDLAHPDIAHDLARPAVPASAAGWLLEGLRRRRQAGNGPLTVLSCDNLTDNGRKLQAAVLALAGAQGDAALADWITGEVAFPGTMVDSITPATDDALRERVRSALELEDAWPVQREAFAQWVIEDALKPNAPDLALAGAQLTRDVRPFEQAKLRLLNGAHSTLAYLGRLMGLECVVDTMAEPRLAAFVERLMRQDIAPSLTPSADLDLEGYITAILARFRNPALRHRLSQIAADGSQKLPQRLLGTLCEALEAGRPIERLCVPVAAWMVFVTQEGRAGALLDDPMADVLRSTALGGGDATMPDRFLAFDTIFPAQLSASARFRTALTAACQALGRKDFSILDG